jgi:hypothetical protein
MSEVDQMELLPDPLVVQKGNKLYKFRDDGESCYFWARLEYSLELISDAPVPGATAWADVAPGHWSL